VTKIMARAGPEFVQHTRQALRKSPGKNLDQIDQNGCKLGRRMHLTTGWTAAIRQTSRFLSGEACQSLLVPYNGPTECELEAFPVTEIWAATRADVVQ
jgi:hypothetical protein